MIEALHRTPPPYAASVSPEACEMLLSLADDELVIGHRHSEWLGLSPFLEEDLTMASIAQDELGHARALYALLWPDWADRDADITRRPATAWRSSAIAERTASQWEDALVRHFLYDCIEIHRWRALASHHGEAVPGLRDLVVRIEAEERFHRDHSHALVTRLVRDPVGRARIHKAISRWIHDAGALVAELSGEARTSATDALIAALHAAGVEKTLIADSVLNGGFAQPNREFRHADGASAFASFVAVVEADTSARW